MLVFGKHQVDVYIIVNVTEYENISHSLRSKKLKQAGKKERDA